MKNEIEELNEEGISEAIQLNQIKSKLLQTLILKILRLDTIGEIYKASDKLNGVEFIDSVLKHLGVSYECSEEDIKSIPRNTPFIVLSNHPYGGIDGLVLLSILLKVRPDFKIMANYLLEKIPQVNEHIVKVDPYENKNNKRLNIVAIKRSLNLLSNGIPIGVFPAGEVSSFKLNGMRISDKQWHPVLGKMILKSNVNVVPVYFSGHNSLLFNMLGFINPALRTMRLPHEMLNKKEEKIIVRIGKPVSIETIQELKDPDTLLRFLRAKVYSLGSAINVHDFFHLPIKIGGKRQQKIIDAVDVLALETEVNRITLTKDLLFSFKEFDVFASSAADIPNILREISRLREVTFREVGEGTSESFDFDEFDLHYKHLFVWDRNLKKIAGAYRLGEGRKLFRRYKQKGFYLNNLFKFKKEFNPIFKSSIELGRSFVIKEYQRRPFVLMLLWKGIHHFVKQSTVEYKYLIGPVSISNSFNKLSKDILVEYIQNEHFDAELSQYVKPRKKYKFQSKGEGKKLLKTKMKDIKFVDQLIADIEPSKSKVPVLLKKYLAQNAKIIAFNIDPKFNKSLDGLVVMKLSDVPNDTFEMLA
jgi:putative hemolysin